MFLIAPTTMSSSAFFFFNDTATTEIYTLSLHDALPICHRPRKSTQGDDRAGGAQRPVEQFPERPPGRYRRQAYGRTLPLESRRSHPNQKYSLRRQLSAIQSRRNLSQRKTRRR